MRSNMISQNYTASSFETHHRPHCEPGSLGTACGSEASLGDKVLVDEISGGTSIDHGFRGRLFHSVRRF